MKKRILITTCTGLFLLLGFMISSYRPIYAVDVISPACQNAQGGQTPAVCRDNNPNSANPLFGPNGVLKTYVQILALIIGVMAVLTMMFAGLKFITSGGDPNSISSAQKTIIYAAVGLAVAAVAQLLVTFVLSKVNS